MPTVINVDIRRRGTASRREFRFEQKEWDWGGIVGPARSSSNELKEEEEQQQQQALPPPEPPTPAVTTPTIGSKKVSTQQAPSPERNAIPRRRRRKKKKHSAVAQPDSSEQEQDDTNRPTDDWVYNNYGTIEPVDHSAKIVTSNQKIAEHKTPTLAVSESKVHVSPDEDENDSNSNCTESSMHSRPKVLAVYHFPVGTSPFASSQEKDDEEEPLTLTPRRKIPLPVDNTSSPPITGRQRHKSVVQDVELFDAVTANATDSPLCTSSLSSIKSLADVVHEQGLVSKQDFFSVSSYTPAMVLDIVEADDMKASQGQIGTHLQWWHANNQLFLSATSSHTDGYWDSEGGKHLRWSAHVLDWIWIFCNKSQVLERFPNPQQIGASSKRNEACVLRLGWRSDNESVSDYEILGTLEDLMHLHHAYNNGPIPDSIVAGLVVQVMGCVCTMHQCGVTHNDLGLDSFLLALRKTKQTGEVSGWFLACVDLGSAAQVGKIPMTTGACNDTPQSDTALSFNHDLYSIANIAFLLLSGGVSLSWRRNDDGSIDLPWKRHVFGNLYRRGQIAWEDLFQSLLNPTSAVCGMHVLGAQDEPTSGWSESLSAAFNLVSSLSRPTQKAELEFLRQLMEHMQHERVVGQWRIAESARFPVKLSREAIVHAKTACRQAGATQRPQEENDNTSLEHEVLTLWKEKDQLQSQVAESSDKVQRTMAECDARLREAENVHQRQLEQHRTEMEALQQQLENQCTQADAKLKGAEQTNTGLMARLEKATHDHVLEMDASRRSHLQVAEIGRKRMRNLEKQGFDTEQQMVLTEQEFQRIIDQQEEMLRRMQLELSTIEQMLGQQPQQRLEFINQLENMQTTQLRAALHNANEETAHLKATNRECMQELTSLEMKVSDLQNNKKQLKETHRVECEKLQKEKDELAAAGLNREHDLRVQIEESEKEKYNLIIEGKDEELERARQTAAEKLSTTNDLAFILEAQLETAREELSALQSICDNETKKVHADHEESLRALSEKHKAEREGLQELLADLKSKLSWQSEERKRQDDRIEDLSNEVSTLKEAMIDKSKLQEKSELHLKKEISLLENEVTTKAALVKECTRKLQDQQDEMAHHQSSLDSQLQAFQREQTEREERVRERERDLERRMLAFEAEMRRQTMLGPYNQNIYTTASHPSPMDEAKRKSLVPSLESRDSQAAIGVKRKAPSPSPSLEANDEIFASAKPPAPTKRKRRTSWSSRFQQATSAIIPGQSLTMVGVVQAMTRKHGSSRVVFGDPSDDSETEL